ncbi:MAG: hypothetical protein KIT10_11905 [Flavobacteriales bacterium]|nr:hypothetical protein [Flavobacteriales bacterium]
MSAVLITACRKEARGPALPGSTSEAAQVNPTPRIKAFIERALASDAKSGGFLSVDSAVWYVEAALNYSMTGSGLPNEDIVVYPFEVLVETIGDHVDAHATSQAFLSFATSMEAVADAGRHWVIVDIVAERSGSRLKLDCFAYSATGGAKLNTNFGSNDYWLWGGGSSSCACPSHTGNNPGICADKRIEARINAAIGSIGVDCYHINVETWYIRDSQNLGSNQYGYDDFLNPNDSTQWDWFFDYQTYACVTSGGCTSCLDPTDHSFYTQGTWDVAQTIRATHCPTKDLVVAAVNGTTLTCTGGCGFYLHVADFTYGFKVCGEDS